MAMDGTRDLPGIIEHVSQVHPGQPVAACGAARSSCSAPGMSRTSRRQCLPDFPIVISAGTTGPWGISAGWTSPRGKAHGTRRRGCARRESRSSALAAPAESRPWRWPPAALGACIAWTLTRSSSPTSSRQVIYTEDDLGTPKAEAAVARLRRLNSDIEVTGERLEATSVEDVASLARDCDVLLLSADKPPELRTWTNRACLAAKRPWVDSGYHGPLVQVGAFVPGAGPCWECSRLVDRDSHAGNGANPQDAPHRPDAVSAAVGAVPAGISGYLAAHLVIALVTGIPAVVPGRIETVNLAALDAPLALAPAPHPECPACGAARVTGCTRLWRRRRLGPHAAAGSRRVAHPAAPLVRAPGRRRLGNRPAGDRRLHRGHLT